MDRPRKVNRKRLPRNFYNYFDVCKMEGIPSTRAKNAVNRDKVEGIKSLKELRPVEHLFEVFENPRKGGMRYSYGIRRSYYDHWKVTGEVPIRPPGKPAFKLDPDNLCNVNIRNFPKATYEKLKKIVDNANAVSIRKVGYHEMIAVAVEEFVERRYEYLDLEDEE